MTGDAMMWQVFADGSPLLACTADDRNCQVSPATPVLNRTRASIWCGDAFCERHLALVGLGQRDPLTPDELGDELDGLLDRYFGDAGLSLAEEARIVGGLAARLVERIADSIEANR